MSSDDWLAPDTCGVKLAEFEKLAQIIGGAGSKLDELSSLLALTLAKAGVSTAPAQDVGRIATWARIHGPDLKRRAQLAHDMNRDKPHVVATRIDGTFVLLPDRFQDQIAVLDAEKAATLLQKAAGGDPKALHALWLMGRMPNNPYFAKTLLEQLGAGGLAELPIKLAERLRLDITSFSNSLDIDAAETRSALATLRQALALDTDPTSHAYLGDNYLTALTAAGRQCFPPGAFPPAGFSGYQSLSAVLGAEGPGKFSAMFMRVVGQDMLKYDQETTHELSGYGKQLPDLSGKLGLGNALSPDTINVTGTPDPGLVGKGDFLIGLLQAAASSKEGAQALLLGPLPSSGETLSYLLHDRRALWGLSDRGASLGRALDAAASAGDPESRQLFLQAIATLAPDVLQHIKWASPDNRTDGLAISEDDKRFLDQLSGLRGPLGHMLAAHISEVADTFSTAHEGNLSDVPDQAKLLAVIADVSQESGAFTALVEAQLSRVGTELDSYFANGRRSFDGVQHELEMLGRLLTLRRETMRARGEGTAKYNDDVRSIVSQVAGYFPLPSTKLGPLSAVADEIKNYSIDELKDLISEHFSDNSEKSNTPEMRSFEAELIKRRVEQVAFISAVIHGHFKTADITGKSFAPNGKFLPPQTWSADQRRDFHTWLHFRQSKIFDETDDIRGIIDNISQETLGTLLLNERPPK